ncbi:MAG: hypothetical protein MMC33_007001 [Icmadophila ericetorum]|nr:hypothetical protein [Icmadophila ericetorum]
MQRLSRPDWLDLAKPQAQTPHAFSSNRASMSPSHSLAAAPPANPEPAYIAASAASQIVSTEHQSQYAWSEHDSIDNIAIIAPPALSLVNAFLDRLLYNFLACARSTSLASLRPAVIEVLKPKLAKDAIIGADEELQEFLGGGDDEELQSFHNGQEPPTDWDLDTVWKRTRLRCMVYTRLGDMEEEDEEMYVEQENLGHTTGPHRLSRDLGIVSPAAAIFLTSILEFIGEQALMVAGDAAYRRAESDKTPSNKRKSGATWRVVVEEIDMEKVAFNTTLGRLWRSWRKLVRSPKNSISRNYSHDMGGGRSSSRKSSLSIMDRTMYSAKHDHRPSVDEVLLADEPALIPLPSTENDVAEIEVPGYQPMATRRGGLEVTKGDQNRPYSMVIYPEPGLHAFAQSPSPPQSPISSESTIADGITSPKHQRSHSLPTPVQTPFVLAPEYPSQDAATEETPTETPGEVPFVQEQAATPTGITNDSVRDFSSMGERVLHAPSSNPNLAYGGSVLNAISQHAARELETSPNGMLKVPNQRPNVLEETRSISSRSNQSSPERPREHGLTHYDTASSTQPYSAPEVSPMVGEFTSIHNRQPDSGEVSPIESDDYELPHTKNAPFVSNVVRQEKFDEYPYQQAATSRRAIEESTQNMPETNLPTKSRQRRKDGPTKEDIAKDDKREAYIVLDHVPSPDMQTSSIMSYTGRDMQVDGAIINGRSGSAGHDNGAPGLEPLREMVEAAHDTSDDASSTVPSQSERTKNFYAMKPAPLSITAQSSARSTPNGNKGADLRSQLPTVYTGALAERAAVQRVSPQPIPTREPTTPQGRLSESSMRDTRFGYPSTSPVSQKKAMASWQHAEDKREQFPSRTPSSGSRSFHDEKRRTSEDPKLKQQSFERLIKSDETIKYNLTPPTVRDIEGAEEPRWSSYQQTGPGSPKSPSRNDRPSSLQSQTRRSGVPTPKGLNGLRSNPSNEKPRSVSSVSNYSMANNASAKPSFQITSGPSIKQGDRPIAREPTVESGSTRDFADFIRSTGPEQTKSLPKIPPPRPTTGSRPASAISGSTTTASNTGPRTVGKGRTGIIPVSAVKAKTLKKNNRLQARDATINRNDETSDLIDFIRQGPPAERNEGNHRIPRTVAPFRSTMDSDEIQALGQGRTRDTNSVASTMDSSFQNKSLHSSINSRTGLLESNRNTSRISKSSSFEKKRPSAVDDTPMPKRKQRRVRDPYAIDTDSEEDDDAMNTPRARENKEESLLDFLNSTPPGSQVFGRSTIESIPESNGSNGRTLQRKVSAPSMRAQFATSGASGNASRVMGSNHSPQSSANRGRVDKQQSSSPYGPRETSPHLPVQTTSKLDQFRPTQPTYAAHMDRNRKASISNRAAAKPIQARGERGDVDGMRDLANFLKNSGPPEEITSRPTPVAPVKQGGGFSRMFSKRKKSIGLAN